MAYCHKEVKLAYSTRRPGSGWTRVVSNTDYGNVVSNYAVALQQALQAQAQTELESKIFNYKNGLLSYTDLKKFLDSRLAGELAGSQKELDLRQLIQEVDTFENNKNKDIERAKLESKFSKNGISAAERVMIENDLLKFYKQGTPEYSEQLSVISQAKELERQEKKNERVAELEGKLSEGGLSTGEQIQVLEEARSLSEKGSQEYSEYSAKIGLLKDQKREEDLMQRRNEAVSEMLDQFAPGGLTNEELLQINKKEQEFAEKGSEDYIKLKQAEADILGAINDSGSGSAETEMEERSALSYAMRADELSGVEDQFGRGELSVQEYLEKKASLLGLMEEDQTYGKYSTDEQAELYNRVREYEEQRNKVDSGRGVVIREGNKKVIVDPADLGRMGKKESILYTDEQGNSREIERTVVTIDDENGVSKEYFVREDGQLEEVVAGEARDSSGNVVKIKTNTGNKFDPASNAVKKAAPQVTAKVPAPKPSGSVLGSSSSKSSGKSSSSSKSSSKSSSSTTKATSVAYNAVKKATTNNVSYSTAKPVAKVGNSKVTKGNIKGTLDFGVTEKLKVGSKVKKAVSSIKNLFKR